MEGVHRDAASLPAPGELEGAEQVGSFRCAERVERGELLLALEVVEVELGPGRRGDEHDPRVAGSQRGLEASREEEGAEVVGPEHLFETVLRATVVLVDGGRVYERIDPRHRGEQPCGGR